MSGYINEICNYKSNSIVEIIKCLILNHSDNHNTYHKYKCPDYQYQCPSVEDADSDATNILGDNN